MSSKVFKFPLVLFIYSLFISIRVMMPFRGIMPFVSGEHKSKTKGTEEQMYFFFFFFFFFCSREHRKLIL